MALDITEDTRVSWKLIAPLIALAFYAGGSAVVLTQHGSDITALKVRMDVADREHMKLERSLEGHTRESAERWKHIDESLREIKDFLGVRRRPVAGGTAP